MPCWGQDTRLVPVLSCERTDGPSCAPQLQLQLPAGTQAPRCPSAGHSAALHVSPGPWGMPEGPVGSCGEGSCFRLPGFACGGQVPCLRAERVGCSLGRPGPQPGWQRLGAKGLAPKLQALQRRRGRWQHGDSLWPSCRQRNLAQEAIVPHTMGPGGPWEGRGPRLVEPDLDPDPLPIVPSTLAWPLRLALARKVDGCSCLRTRAPARGWAARDLPS